MNVQLVRGSWYEWYPWTRSSGTHSMNESYHSQQKVMSHINVELVCGLWDQWCFLGLFFRGKKWTMQHFIMYILTTSSAVNQMVLWWVITQFCIAILLKNKKIQRWSIIRIPLFRFCGRVGAVTIFENRLSEQNEQASERERERYFCRWVLATQLVIILALELSCTIWISMTSRASVAQLVRARDCQSLGRRFDSV